MAPFFPGRPPHDVATGQPHFYEKKPDDTFRLWGAGIDQKNDDGADGKDMPWAPSRVR